MFGIDPDHIIPLAFLTLLALSLLGSMLGSATFRNAMIWVLIFGGVMLGAGLWDDISTEMNQRQTVFTDTRVEVPKSADNHFRLTLKINDVDVEFLVDTGASQMVLSQSDATRVGLDPANLPYIGRAMTANGEVATAPVWLDRVDLGQMRDTGVRASVNSGAMDTSLLGMSYLGLFQSIEITRDTLVLTR